LKVMSRIALKIEKNVEFKKAMSTRDLPEGISITEAISHSAIIVARQLDASAIMTPTTHGLTPKMVSRYRPSIPIIALSSNPVTLRKLSLIWGVRQVEVEYSDDMNVMMKRAKEVAVKTGFKEGNQLVVTASVPSGGPTNLIKIEVI
jgi:pyruvate kinase